MYSRSSVVVVVTVLVTPPFSSNSRFTTVVGPAELLTAFASLKSDGGATMLPLFLVDLLCCREVPKSVKKSGQWLN